jgi:hypothetical protein
MINDEVLGLRCGVIFSEEALGCAKHRVSFTELAGSVQRRAEYHVASLASFTISIPLLMASSFLGIRWW